MISKIKDLLPPFFVRVLQNLFLFKVQWKGNYKSYDDAAKACKGYEDSALVNMVYEKAQLFRQEIFSEKIIHGDTNFIQTILGLCLSANGKNLNVIDFGGGFGNHYFIAKALFKEKYNIKWCIVETIATVNRATVFKNDELFFFNDIQLAVEELGHVDILFSSSTLQYLPEPYAMLKTITAIKASYLCIIRVPLLIENEEKYAVQFSKYSANGPGGVPNGMVEGVAQYPINFLSKNKVEKIIEEKYNIRLVMDENSETYTYRFRSIKLYGYWATLADEQSELA